MDAHQWGGVAGVINQKKLLEYTKSSMSHALSHAENPPKIDIIARSRKKIEKIRKSAFRVFDYLSNKKKVHENRSSGY